MKRTKKVGTTGRFGSRYGRKVKVKLRSIEAEQRKTHVCPTCKRVALKRVAAGIWECRKCGAKIAGKAYKPGV